MATDILQTILIGGIGVLAMFFVIWLIHLFLNNAGVVDVGWGLGFILLSAVYILRGEGFNLRNTLYFLMVALWGLRIALFLIKRISSEGHEDKRYQKLRTEWKDNVPLKFFFFFEFQAVLQVILAIPFLIVSLNPAPGITAQEFLGVIVFAIALAGETIADEQLHGFKSDPRNKGKTCDIGFWHYSRHPNYFFEWLIWMGLFIYALGTPWGWVGVLSPFLMFYLMIYVSGVPMAEEQALKTRGEDYRRYKETTSMFFPMPKRKAVS